MSIKEREKFIRWHDEQRKSGVEFNFKKEIMDYCKLDVEILKRACLKFRELVMECGKICPFTDYCAIASTCMKVFRRNF